ncbi:MAG: hypothetical protein IKK50_07005 [Ruminiclostridium sp.]|nr:hypothetical protein [Ruminiclostridium sp.]
MPGISLQMIDRSVSSHWWREVVKHFLRVGDALEIRCWKEEEEEIGLASAYGPLTEEGYEVSIKGTVTAEFLEEILSDEPADKTIYNKMTKYFTINVERGDLRFCSAHYGTELYIEGATEEDVSFFQNIMSPYEDDEYFSVHY